MNRNIQIDLTMTNNCNFKCDYCFERDTQDISSISDKTVEDFIVFIRKLEDSDLVRNHFSGITVNFWGGEPTLEMDKIEHIIEIFKDDPMLQFFIFTNGSNQRVYDLALKYKDVMFDYKDYQNNQQHEPKVFIQISYDGDILHKKHRVWKSGKESLISTKELIYKFIDDNVPVTLKSTICLDDIEYMWDAYNDFLEINEYCRQKNYRWPLTYYPTIDYYNGRNVRFRMRKEGWKSSKCFSKDS